MGLRDQMNNKPWLGWAFAGVLLIAGVVFYLTRTSKGNVYENMQETITIRCTETGDEWTEYRGRLEKYLRNYARDHGNQLDPSVGLPHPETGRLTGFPVASEWNDMIERINREKRERRDK